MFEPKVDLYPVAIEPSQDRDWRRNDFTSNPLGANIVIAFLPNLTTGM